MSKMKPEVAKRRIESFEKRFGKAHLYLAYHAAFPLSLTPDLLYRLWANFQRDIHGEVLGIPWIAVADLLLSSLFNEVGHELYEMDLVVRNLLVSRLKEDEKFGQQRINELSDFLLEYVQQQILSDDPDIQDFAQAQRWVALAYTRPNEAARELALAFSKLDVKDTTELVRMASLAETFAEPLTEFQPLLIYARGMEKFARGQLEVAKAELSKVLDEANQIKIAGADLPVPKQIKANLPDQPEQLVTNSKNLLTKSRPQALELILAMLFILGFLGSGYWWLNRSGINLGSMSNNQSQQVGSNIENFAQVSNIPSGLFTYGGSTTWAPIRTKVDSVIQTVFPQFQLRYTDPTSGAPGSGTGIKMLLNNQLAFSQSLRSITDEEYQQTQQQGFRLKEIPVAIDGIAIAVNPSLNIPGLTVAQVKDIYTGKITNWQQVGGPNLPITPYSRRLEEGGTVELFANNILGGEKFGENVQYISTTTQALRVVAKNTGGLYYASAPEVLAQCVVKPLPLGRTADKLVPPYQEPSVPLSECSQKRNQLNAAAFQSDQYPITRRLFVIVKQNGQIDQQAGEAYAKLLLTNQGQELIEQAGFVRIR